MTLCMLARDSKEKVKLSPLMSAKTASLVFAPSPCRAHRTPPQDSASRAPSTEPGPGPPRRTGRRGRALPRGGPRTRGTGHGGLALPRGGPRSIALASDCLAGWLGPETEAMDGAPAGCETARASSVLRHPGKAVGPPPACRCRCRGPRAEAVRKPQGHILRRRIRNYTHRWSSATDKSSDVTSVSTEEVDAKVPRRKPHSSNPSTETY